CETEVAELQIEVDHRDALALLGERDAEVRARERLPCPTLRSENDDHRRGPNGFLSDGTRLPGDGLLDCELDLVGRRRQRDEVVCAGLECTANESVRRALQEDDHRPICVLLDCVVDEEERSFGVARARDDDNVRLGLFERRPALLETLEDADDLVRRVVRQRPFDRRPVDAVVKRDECPHRARHRPPPRRTVSSETIRGRVWRAPAAGRRITQILPLSEAQASLPACWSVTRRVSDPPAANMTGMFWRSVLMTEP